MRKLLLMIALASGLILAVAGSAHDGRFVSHALPQAETRASAEQALPHASGSPEGYARGEERSRSGVPTMESMMGGMMEMMSSMKNMMSRMMAGGMTGGCPMMDYGSTSAPMATR